MTSPPSDDTGKDQSSQRRRPPVPRDLTLIAYEVEGGSVSSPMDPELVPAPRRRHWIADETRGWAAHCLPLMLANQAGWVLLNPFTVTATWNGGPGTGDVTIEYAEAEKGPVRSHFGAGILTWGIPYLFRTPPGWNLLARGPANHPKDGISPLEGLVETDWAVATFTMNWKMTRPGLPVRFEAGEPFCMLVPQRRFDLERFRPEFRPLEEDADLYEQAREWTLSRRRSHGERHLAAFVDADDETERTWEGHYYYGTSPGGASSDEHQRTLRLAAFERRTEDTSR